MKRRRLVDVGLLGSGILMVMLLAGCGGSSASGLGQQPLSAVQVKTEVPKQVQVDHSYAFEIALTPADGSQELSDIVVEQTTVAHTQPNVVGTPGASIAKAFGAGYEPYAIAQLSSGTFDVQMVGEQMQSLRQPSVSWNWNITPHQSGTQVISGSIAIEWIPTKQANGALPPPKFVISNIQRAFDVQGNGVTLPFDPSVISIGTLDLGSLVTQILAALIAAALIWWISVMVARSIGARRKEQERENAQIGVRPPDRDRYGGR